MMDLRYHLASLMSIFLALAVGIVVGISLGSSERQAATIRVLQQDVAAIRSEDSRLKEVNNDLQRRLARHEEAVEQDLLPVAIRGRLAGNRVALILVGEAAEALRAPIGRALHLSGADLLILRLPRGERPAEEDLGRPAAGAAGSTGAGGASGASSAATGPPGGVETNAGLLARALLAGRPALLDELRARIPALDESGELRAPIRRILLVCPNDQADYARRAAAGAGLEAALTRLAREAGAILVAAEPEVVPSSSPAPALGTASREATSLLPALAGQGASTVDNVDSAMGQIAAVLALAGTPGNFGTGPSATRVLPLPASEEGRRSGRRGAWPDSQP